jgi:hypothetical protein
VRDVEASLVSDNVSIFTAVDCEEKLVGLYKALPSLSTAEFDNNLILKQCTPDGFADVIR